MHYCEEINQNCNARGKLNCEKKRHNRKKKSLARKVKITRKDQLQEKSNHNCENCSEWLRNCEKKRNNCKKKVISATAREKKQQLRYKFPNVKTTRHQTKRSNRSCASHFLSSEKGNDR